MKQRTLRATYLAVLMAPIVLVAGCGGGSAPATAVPTTPPAATTNAPPAVAMSFGSGVTAQNDGQLVATQGSTIQVSSAGSADPNGDALTFEWALAAKPTTSAAALSASAGPTSSFTADVMGDYVISLKANDGRGGITDRKTTVTVNNQPPQATLVVTVNYTGTSTTKPDQSVAVGSAIVLNGTGSVDPNGDALTATWNLVEAPVGSTATLDTNTPMVARLVPDRLGSFKVRARLTDSKGAWTDTVFVFVADNTPPNPVMTSTVTPAAGATTSLTTSVGYDVLLNSAGSADADGDTFTYAWTLLSKPTASTAVLSSTAAASTQFSPDKLGTYVARLRLTDSKGATADHTVNVVVNNTRPTVAVGSNATPSAIPSSAPIRLPLNTEVTLRGADSSDPDGDVLTYAWSLTAKPTGSTATLSSSTAANVKMTVDLRGTYTARLRVTDTKGAFSERTVTVEAGNAVPRPVIDRDRVMVVVGSPALLSGALSFDDDGDSLTYQWAVDSKPTGSAPALATPTSATTRLTPDRAGTYVLALTVNDGKQTATSFVTVYAKATALGAVTLPFRPVEARYSRGLELLVMTQESPAAVRILDPVTSALKTVVLPLPAKSLAVSPNGRRAVVAHDAAASFINLETATLVRTVTTTQSHTVAFLTDANFAYLTGESSASFFMPHVTVVDFNTGLASGATTGGMFYGSLFGVYSNVARKAFTVTNSLSPTDISYFTIDAASNAVTAGGDSPYHGDYVMGYPLFLSATEDRVITAYGTMFRTSDLTYAGTLPGLLYPSTLLSLSANPATVEETLAIVYSGALPTSYSRWTGALLTPQPDLPVPQVGGQAAFARAAFHSGSGNHVLIVQTGSSDPYDTTAAIHVIYR